MLVECQYSRFHPLPDLFDTIICLILVTNKGIQKKIGWAPLYGPLAPGGVWPRSSVVSLYCPSVNSLHLDVTSPAYWLLLYCCTDVLRGALAEDNTSLLPPIGGNVVEGPYKTGRKKKHIFYIYNLKHGPPLPTCAFRWQIQINF